MICHTIRDILVSASETYGNSDAIRYKEGKNNIVSKTYQELRRDSERFSAVLAALGEQGSHIAITGMTSYSWLTAYLGTVNSGSVAVPLDVSLPADEMCELINRADATVFVVDEIRADVAAMAKEHCPKLKHLISMQKEDTGEDMLSLGSLLSEQKEGFDFSPAPDQLATIMFTSGTTGKSKGVMLSHRNLAENATCLDMKFPQGTVLMSVLPIHHAYCLSMDFFCILTSPFTNKRFSEALSRHFLKQRPFRLPVPVFSQTEAFPAPCHCFFTEKHSFLPLITEKY